MRDRIPVREARDGIAAGRSHGRTSAGRREVIELPVNRYPRLHHSEDTAVIVRRADSISGMLATACRSFSGEFSASQVSASA